MKPQHRIPAGVWVLGFVSMLMDVSSEMIHGLLPLYLTVGLGASALTVGIIEGIAESTALIVKVFSGALSDRWRRRKAITAFGYGLAALSKPLFALATGPMLVFVARFLDRIGKGIRGAPRDALLVVDIDAAARGRVFGFHRAMDTLGAVVGPLLGLAGYELFDHQIPPLLWVAVVPAVLSVALVFLVRETRRVLPRAERRAVFARVGELPGRYWRVTTALVQSMSARPFHAPLVASASVSASRTPAGVIASTITSAAARAAGVVGRPPTVAATAAARSLERPAMATSWPARAQRVPRWGVAMVTRRRTRGAPPRRSV